MAATETYKKGQIIQIARGNLLARLSKKPLAKGELFIHTEDKKLLASTEKVYDLVTKSYLKVISTGDIFVGDNSARQLYALGNGGLKWGGVSFEDTWEKCQAVAKQFPNHIYMFSGPNKIYRTQYDDGRAADDYAKQPKRVNEQYVAGNNKFPDTDPNLDHDEWVNEINPGDLYFYSPIFDQLVIFSLTRASDALTKINVKALVSDSMRALLAEDDDNKASTLKDFLDGPARHYQYLAEDNGWNPVTVSQACVIERHPELGQAGTTVTAGKISVDPRDDGDGTIHFVPFSGENPGQNKYTTTLKGLEKETLYEGDLIITMPNSGSDGGVHYTKVSLYSKLLELIQPEFKGRADQYATDIWAEGLGVGGDGDYEGDLSYFANHDTLKDFIDRLFLTKVDIDPTTNKIISSQLPDFLLGAPKYMGHFFADLDYWRNLPTDTKALDWAKYLIEHDSNAKNPNLENLDNSEDDTSGDSEGNNVSGSKKVNDMMKSGCYWIYTGDTVNIGAYTTLFHLDSDQEADDYTTKYTQDSLEQAYRDYLAAKAARETVLNVKNTKQQVVDGLVAKANSYDKSIASLTALLETKNALLADAVATYNKAVAKYSGQYSPESLTEKIADCTLENYLANDESYQELLTAQTNAIAAEREALEEIKLSEESAKSHSSVAQTIIDTAATIAELNEEISEINTEIANLKSQKTAKEADIATLQSKASALQTNIDSLKAELQGYEDRAKGVNGDPEQLSEEEVARMQELREEIIPTQEAALKQTNDNIATAQSELTAITNSITEYSSNLSSKQESLLLTQSKKANAEKVLEDSVKAYLKANEIAWTDDTLSTQISEFASKLLNDVMPLISAKESAISAVDTAKEAKRIVQEADLEELKRTLKEAKETLQQTSDAKELATQEANTVSADLQKAQEVRAEIETQAANAQSELLAAQNALEEADAAVEAADGNYATITSAQHLLSKGDWIIYNAEIDKFDIIDNSSSFVGLLVNGIKVAGVARLIDKTRASKLAVKRIINGQVLPAEVFEEKETDLSATADSVTFSNPASVLFRSGNNPLTNKNFIPVITGDGWAYSSRLEFIEKETGLKVMWGAGDLEDGGHEAYGGPKETSFLMYLENDSVATDYIFNDFNFFDPSVDNDHRIVTTKRIKTSADGSGKAGLDFLQFNFLPDVSDPKYKFAMKIEDRPTLSLPQYSGVLTTEAYVNQGFTVVKAIIEDLYEKIIDETTKGHENWLQTVRIKYGSDGRVLKNSKGEVVKEIYDSKVLQEYTKDQSLLLKLFYDDVESNKDFKSYEENKTTKYSVLSTYKKLLYSQLFQIVSTVDIDQDKFFNYKLGATDGNVVEILNPSEAREGEQPENILPNHSGILLNNNSVIDGGEWL